LIRVPGLVAHSVRPDKVIRLSGFRKMRFPDRAKQTNRLCQQKNGTPTFFSLSNNFFIFPRLGMHLTKVKKLFMVQA
jgi:hypothetical protein